MLKVCSGKKVLIVKVAQNDPLDSSSQKIYFVKGVLRHFETASLSVNVSTIGLVLKLIGENF